MKILFFHIPSLGMYHEIEPILLELQERGHQVIHYNEAGFREYVQNAPFCFSPYSSYEGYFPNRFRSSMNLYELGLLLLETAEHTVDFVEAAVLREWPDLILHSKFTAAPKIAARKHGIPAACLTTGFVFDPRTILDAEREKRNPVDMSNVSSFLRFQKRAKRFYNQHLDGSSDSSDIFVNDEALHLVLGLEMLQPTRSSLYSHCSFVGPTVRIAEYSKSYELIYVSLGSVFVDNKVFFQTCIEALGMPGRRAIISLSGHFSPEEFGKVPDSVELCHFVQQTKILQKAAVFVTHGGNSSVSEAIYCETPMVVVPQIPEQVLRAQLIQRRMLGRYLDPSDVTVDRLRCTVTEVLEDPLFRHNVQEFKASLPKIPAAITACNQIEEFALKNGKRLVKQ
ncbi:MAG TPA: nucleotide disphospho-sugar-binding domain-containing protein [Candidatus Angelobacter sp.]|jgi:MGT family glycosyltransferase|nr:nucleotide disphospho-sugar-binding domain-containing protein [Candidatus Angelobacter sp.]